MKKTLYIKIAILFCIFQSSILFASTTDLKIMTYNIRHQDKKDNRSLKERLPDIVKTITNENPDIVALQETANKTEREELIKKLKAKGYEHSIDYNAKLFFLKKYFYSEKEPFKKENKNKTYGFFKYSNTPSIYDFNATRVALWIKTKDYFIINTHLSSNMENYNNSDLRYQQIKQLKKEIGKINKNNYKIIILGDMNFAIKDKETGKTKKYTGKEQYKLLLKKDSNGHYFHDSYTGDEGTYNRFKTPTPSKKLDYIITDSRLSTKLYKIIKPKKEISPKNYPSDHFPILATITSSIFKARTKKSSQKFTESEDKLYFADLNNDGNDDLIQWNSAYANTYINISNKNGTFGKSKIHAVSHDNKEKKNNHFYFADVNGDGYSDKIYWHPTEKKKPVIYYFDPSKKNFSDNEIPSAGASSGRELTKFYFPLINHDSCADKIYWNPLFIEPKTEKKYVGDKGHLRLYLSTNCQNGKDFKNFSKKYISSISSENNLTQFDFADVNGDKCDDVLQWTPDKKDKYKGKTLIYFAECNGGTRKFRKVPVIHTSGTSTNKETKIYYADVNSDGMADKIWWRHDFNGGKLKIYLSNKTNFSKSPIQDNTGWSQNKNTKYFFPKIRINENNSSNKIYWNNKSSGGKLKTYFSKQK